MVTKKSRKLKRKSPPATSRHKRSGRIPGVDVGDVVDTSAGKKKKVCFNIGGKWFFRMVDPDWRAPGRPPKRKGNRDAGGKGGSGQG